MEAPEQIPVHVLRERLSDITDAASAGRRFVITRNGKARMALVPVSDLELLAALDQSEGARVFRAQTKAARTPWERVRAELGLK